MVRLICIVIGYVFGLFQTGFLYGKLNNLDIRQHGSGNSGSTNVLRTLGWKAGLITFVGDCLKCLLAILLVRLIFKSKHEEILPLLSIYTGLGAILGHNFPFYLGFKGGKGIAATAGIVIAMGFYLIPIPLVLFIGMVFLTGYVSVGSIAVVLSFTMETIVLGQLGHIKLEGWPLYEFYLVVIFLMILALWKHRENISRLRKGTESSVFKKK